MSITSRGMTIKAGLRPRSVVSSLARPLAWAAGFVLALLVFVPWSAFTPVNNDFAQNVWLPARLVLAGADPYFPLPLEVDAALGEHRPAFSGFNGGETYFFIYPLWVAIVFTPLGALPLTLALGIWRAANLVLLVWSVAAVLRVTNPAFSARKPVAIASVLLAGGLALVFRETFVTLYIGQFSILALSLLVGIWGWLIRSREIAGRGKVFGDVLSGVALATLATKPQALGLAVLLILVWSVSRRRWVVPLAAATSLAATLLLPLLLQPSSLLGWLEVIFSGQAGSQVQVSSSVWGLSYNLLPAEVPWVVVAGVLSAVGILLLLPRWRRDIADRQSPVPLSLPVTLCMNSVISPYLLRYEHLLLFMPAMVLIAAAGLPGVSASPAEERGRKMWRLAVYGWLGMLPWAVIALHSFVQKEYMMVITSATLLAICWLADLKWENRRVAGAAA